jgi:site-specific recombinase XerD
MRLIGAVKGPPATAARNRAILAVAYRSGLRISEVLNLCPKDVDAGAGSIRVLNGKGGRSRTVGVDAGALAILAAWSTYRATYPVGEGQPLFCTRSGRAVTTAYVRRLLPHLADLAGIAKRVHAHGLRHTHAAELRGEGVDIGIISKQLGHTSIATTIRYLDHIAPRAVVEAIAARSW